ncbi:MAG: hypothetical protein J6X51_03195 [Bacteroidales bacterium]|nr:hypothetical protein [Bacteroidales bacterium]
MNRRPTYRPHLAQIPADSFRGGPCDSRDPRRFPRDPRRFMNPLMGKAIIPPANVHCSLDIVHWSCFGSRYYSSDLSIWLSVDPMAAKYPSLSPYTYCADNPVRLVDPNGKDEWGFLKHKGYEQQY